ncbi:hypothetical protein K438DRAFT_1785737 [Mycena galopus ATCC 62051]|nr:hypothetical protein K438DRAFT_1785737 [Mycena galopus ATCC 62051]
MSCDIPFLSPTSRVCPRHRGSVPDIAGLSPTPRLCPTFTGAISWRPGGSDGFRKVSVHPLWPLENANCPCNPNLVGIRLARLDLGCIRNGSGIKRNSSVWTAQFALGIWKRSVLCTLSPESRACLMYNSVVSEKPRTTSVFMGTVHQGFRGEIILQGSSKKKKKAPGDAPPPWGRPALRKFASRAPDSPVSESAIGLGVALSGEERQATQLAGEEYGAPSERDNSKDKPIWLQSVNQDRDGWELVDIINTEDLPKWFHVQHYKNDYQPKGYYPSQITELHWFGHPGDSPHDVRARKFVVRWAKHVSVGSELRYEATKEDRPEEDSEGELKGDAQGSDQKMASTDDSRAGYMAIVRGHTAVARIHIGNRPYVEALGEFYAPTLEVARSKENEEAVHLLIPPSAANSRRQPGGPRTHGDARRKRRAGALEHLRNAVAAGGKPVDEHSAKKVESAMDLKISRAKISKTATENQWHHMRGRKCTNEMQYMCEGGAAKEHKILEKLCPKEYRGRQNAKAMECNETKSTSMPHRRAGTKSHPHILPASAMWCTLKGAAAASRNPEGARGGRARRGCGLERRFWGEASLAEEMNGEKWENARERCECLAHPAFTRRACYAPRGETAQHSSKALSSKCRHKAKTSRCWRRPRVRAPLPRSLPLREAPSSRSTHSRNRFHPLPEVPKRGIRAKRITAAGASTHHTNTPPSPVKAPSRPLPINSSWHWRSSPQCQMPKSEPYAQGPRSASKSRLLRNAKKGRRTRHEREWRRRKESEMRRQGRTRSRGKVGGRANPPAQED